MNTINHYDVYENAPAKEPDRQYYFMDQLRAVLKERFDELIRSGEAEKRYGKEQLKSMIDNRLYAGFCVVTFGCQMSARDSEKLSGVLKEIGCTEALEETAADIVMFNTCTVRENANEHLYGRLGRLKQSKKNNKDMIIGVCGCMMQETDEVEKLKTKYPYVDVIFGTHNLYTFPELLFKLLRKRDGIIDPVASMDKEVIASSEDDQLRYEKLLRYGDTNKKDIEKLFRKPVVSVWKDSKDIVEDLPSVRKYPFKQGVNIMYGCDNFCSYCIVPYVRGREKSRAPEEIYAEIKKAASEGVKEIMLLGQNVNSYRGGITFPELLKNVDELVSDTGIERVRFMTSHPKDLSDELIEAMAGTKKVCRQFHLPLQSGSDVILKRMNRHYDKAAFLSRAHKLKQEMPDISLSTDIIVGFPGETERDFLDTLDVLSEVRFDSAYTFIYSRREGTPAASYEDQIAQDIIKDRFDRLLKLQNGIVSENLGKLTGGTYKALFEDISEYDESLISGKLESGTTVHVPGDASMLGKIADVRLLECKGFYFTGEIVK